MIGIKNPIPKLMMKIQGVKYGKGCAFYGLPVIICTKDSSMTLGDGVVCVSSFLSNLVGLYQRSIILARAGAKVVLEDDVRMSGVTIYSRESIRIGKHTSIGGNVKIFDHDFHPIDPQERLDHPNSGMKTRPIDIGENVFIGTNAIILKGSRIGNNCVIGAGAVVSGAFEDNTVIAGNPARVIKKLESGEKV
jgi:acetyltransferase-like isoleucine patch superfamily enzyme